MDGRRSEVNAAKKGQKRNDISNDMLVGLVKDAIFCDGSGLACIWLRKLNSLQKSARGIGSL